MTCADLAKGKAIKIQNASPTKQPLELALVPSAAGGTFAGACGGLMITAPTTVPPGATVSAHLSAAKPAALKAALAGLIVARGGAGEAAVVPLAVTPPVDSGAAMPLITTATATKYRGHARTVIWIPVDLGKAKTASFKPGQVLGAVEGDAGRSPVTYVGTKKLGAAHVVGLDVSGLEPGTYNGKVDLLPGVEGGDVALTLTVKDWWPFAIAALLLSLVVAFLVQFLTGVLLPRRTLRIAAGAVADTEGEQTALVQAGHGKWKDSTLTGVADAIAALKSDIASQTRGAWVSLDDKVVAALKAATDALDKKVGHFGELAKKIPALKLMLDSYGKDAPAQLPTLTDETGTEPQLVAHARNYLNKQEIALDDLAKTLDAIDTASSDVHTVSLLRAKVSALWVEAGQLAGEVGDDKEKRAQLSDAKVNLAGVWRQIWDASTNERSTDFATHLGGVENQLSLLWPPEKMRVALLAEPEADLLFADFIPQPAVVAVTTPESVNLATDVAVARNDVAVAMGLGLIAVVVGVIVALVTGMSLLYIGKPFGSFWDYVVMITWGLATPTALAATGAALNSLGGLTALGRRISA